MSDVQAQVREFIVDNFMMGLDESELNNGDSFLETGLIDSTGILEVVGFIEDSFEIEIPDEDMIPENLDSIDNISKYVAGKCKA